MDGMGWIPVDVTPGFYYDTYALLQMAQVPGDIQRTAALEDSGEEVDAPDSLHAGKRPDSKVIDQLKTAVNILWGILLDYELRLLYRFLTMIRSSRKNLTLLEHFRMRYDL